MSPLPSPPRPLRVLLVLACCAALAACSSTERAAERTAANLESAAEDTAEFAGDVGEAVADAAGTAYRAVADLFRDDADADAAALVRPTSAGTAEGTVRFYYEGDALRVHASLRGLQPGAHGFHIHENPACGPADTDGDGRPNPAGAAGSHWDPMSTGDHGAPDDDLTDRHIGDLGNIEAGPDGTIDAEFSVEDFPVDEYPVSQRAIVIHSGRDDLESDPSGNSGTPVGCGVIEAR